MEQWIIETRAYQQVLTHYCTHARSSDTSAVLRQDIGGGYVRCERCGEKFLPDSETGSPHLLLRLKLKEEASTQSAHTF